MNIGQRRQYKSVLASKRFMFTERQKAIMHQAAQRQLFQMSSGQGELNKKKQQAASRKYRAACLKLRKAMAKLCNQPDNRGELMNNTVEEKTDASGGADHLLILADTAELLGSEGQCHKERSLDANVDVEAENNTLRMRGRVRMTQIRHQARFGNRQPVQEAYSRNRHEHTDLERLEGNDNGKSADIGRVQGEMSNQDVEGNGNGESADIGRVRGEMSNQDVQGNDNGEIADTGRVQGETSNQDVQDPRVAARNGSKVSVDIRKHACLVEFMKIYNDKLQRSVKRYAIQPVQKTTGHEKRVEHQDDAHQLALASSSKRDGLLKEDYLNSQKERECPGNNPNKRSICMFNIPGVERDSHYLTLERRVINTCVGRYQDALFERMTNFHKRQMNERKKRFLWHVMSARRERQMAKQQRSFYRSYLEREKRRRAAEQRRVTRIEQRAMNNVPLPNPQPVEESYSEEGSNNQNVATGVEQQAVPVEVDKNFQPRIISEVCESKDLMEMEKRCLASQQTGEKDIEKQGESMDLHLQSNNPQMIEQIQFEEGPNNPKVGACVGQHVVMVDVNQMPLHCTIAEVLEDQCVEAQQQTTDVELEVSSSSSGGRMRFNLLKREARLENPPAERTNWKKLARQGRQDMIPERIDGTSEQI